MSAAITAVVILVMASSGAWIVSRATLWQREGIATYRRSGVRRLPGVQAPWRPAPVGSGHPSGRVPGPGASARPIPSAVPDAVHQGRPVGEDRRDQRDGGRGR